MKNEDLEVSDPKLSQMAVSLLSLLINAVAKQRYTVSEALRHPWITKPNETSAPIPCNFNQEMLSQYEAIDNLH